ncbi:MerR family transcriptional regulator [Pelagicoccus albus]|uniref:MerR family transcriptional regulator n=1 Tax=Pelagicoccus albus TaxID=415222 RepID=A0A7X1B2Z6_9BACT|nr:MerR family transcriptional regulator [Pelagicoccus albus]MBC2604562.1 MerR family transcriptional regulator [Pelagicoccus albus]
MNYSIGEFSRVSQITVKALRLYHEKGILVPDFIDPESGYRYYSQEQIGEARVVSGLKTLGFSLGEIAEVLDECEEDGDLLDQLQKKRRELEKRVASYQRSIREIELVVSGKFADSANDETGEVVVEKTVPDLLVAGYKMTGRYSEIGSGFRILGRKAGKVLSGKPMCLYYDEEYKEDDAHFEPCFEVRSELEIEGVRFRVLDGGNALALLHKGPYERLAESYAKLFAAVKSKGLKIVSPTREIYHKGPGMILKGNPKRYVTEIQFLVR